MEDDCVILAPPQVQFEAAATVLLMLKNLGQIEVDQQLTAVDLLIEERFMHLAPHASAPVLQLKEDFAAINAQMKEGFAHLNERLDGIQMEFMSLFNVTVSRAYNNALRGIHIAFRPVVQFVQGHPEGLMQHCTAFSKAEYGVGTVPLDSLIPQSESSIRAINNHALIDYIHWFLYDDRLARGGRDVEE